MSLSAFSQGLGKIAFLIIFPFLLLPFFSFFRNLQGKRSYGLSSIIHSYASLVKLFFKQEKALTSQQDKTWSCFPFFYFQLALLPLLALSFFAPFAYEGKQIYSEIMRGNLNLLFVYGVICLSPLFVISMSWNMQEVEAVVFGIGKIYQMVSYQIIMTLALISTVVAFQQMNFHSLVEAQSNLGWWNLPRWGLFVQPVSALLFFMGILIYSDRSNYNISSTQRELSKNIVQEYSSLCLLLIKLADFLFLFSLVWLFVTLYFGGYGGGLSSKGSVPGETTLVICQLLTVVGKMIVLFLLIEVLQKKVPLLKIDQLLKLSWKILFPLAFINFMVTVLQNYLS